MPNNEINMDVQGQGSASVSMNPSVDDAAFVGRAEAWAVGKRNGTDVPSTDPAYHNNAKYYATEAAASAEDAHQYTAAAVHTWLENNVDPETGYVLDRTLSEKLAAAPADMVGDLKSALTSNKIPIPCEFEAGGINGTTGEDEAGVYTIRSKGYFVPSYKRKIYIPSDASVLVFKYEGSTATKTNWLSNTTYTLEANKNYRFVEATNPLTQNPNIATITKKITIDLYETIILDHETRITANKTQVDTNTINIAKDEAEIEAIKTNRALLPCEWEAGGINGTTGEEESNQYTIRSTDYVVFNTKKTIYIPSDVLFMVMIYDGSVSHSNWLTNTTYETKAYKNYKFVAATNPMSTNPNVNTLSLKVLMNIFDVDESEPEENPVTITIGTDYNTIASAISYLNNLSDVSTLYKIYIPSGIYTENTLTLTRGNVLIEGEDQNTTIIKTDGRNESGVDEANKHGLKCGVNCTIRNLTFESEYVKYCIHHDNIANAYKAIFENCTFIKGDTTNHGFAYCIGVGAENNQVNVFNNCTFVGKNTNANVPLYGFIWHNWGISSKPSSLEVTDGHFVDCGFAIIGELNSNISGHDIVSFDKCVTNYDYGVRVYFDSANGRVISGTPIIDQPYRIVVNCNSKIPKLVLKDRYEKMYYPLVACSDTVVIES